MGLSVKKWNHPLLTNGQNELVPSFVDDCLSTKEVADKHCISVNTVASHKKNIFAALNITKITELSKLYFTMAVLSAIFGLHGVIENQSRARLLSPQRNIVATNRRNSRRREYAISDYNNWDNINQAA